MNNESFDQITVDYIRDADSGDLLSTVYNKYGDFLYWIVLNQTGMDYERSRDLFNGLFIGLGEKDCRRVRMFSGRSSFRTYLATVWKNMLIDHIRTERNEKRVEYVEPEILDTVQRSGPVTDSPESDLIRSENESAMRKLLKEAMAGIEGLSADEKIILRLRLIMNRKFEDINRMTGLKNSNYMFRAAMQKVRNSMDEKSRGVFLEMIEER